jgi:hypothetical protein
MKQTKFGLVFDPPPGVAWAAVPAIDAAAAAARNSRLLKSTQTPELEAGAT